MVAHRIGQISASTMCRTIEQRIPNVEVPDDMDAAIGLNSEDVDDFFPLLKNEISEQLDQQLARIREDSTRLSLNTSSLGMEQHQQSAISKIGLIDTAQQIRAEKVSSFPPPA